MKKNLTVKALAAVILSAVLLIMPIAALAADGRAEGSAESQTEGIAETETQTEGGTETQTESETETESGTETQTESGTETETESAVPKPECTCTEKCTQHSFNRSCAVCSADYTLCAYMNPNVKITITAPSGWHNDSAKVRVSVEDVAYSGNFAIKSVQAKIAQNGSWTDITDDMLVEISENASVYVLVTDQKGKTYEKNRYIKCFDFTKPTLNAAVSDGLLSIQAHDADSGIRAVYVNGYEFTELANGVLNIRLQQFDAGYQNFTISAVDNAGNMSEFYKTANPYYSDPEKTDGEGENPAEQLPADAQPTKPSSADAQVTEHIKTDGDGNTVSEKKSSSGQKKQEAEGQDAADAEEKSGGGKGKEFYTVRTASEKVFYIIIDRDGDDETVYFLTEITENDLLNVTSGNSGTLPKNSAALESAIPAGKAVPAGGSIAEDAGQKAENAEEATETGEAAETESAEKTATEPEKAAEKASGTNPAASYIFMGIIAAAFTGGAYYFKIVRRKREEFIDEYGNDDDDDDDGGYEDDAEESDDKDDDFFYGTDGEEDE